MSTVKICDRCKKTLFRFDKKLFIAAGYGPVTIYNYDLCPECAEKFFNWMSDDTDDKKER